MSELDFTIVTPSYNYGHYIRECIESVLAQEGVTYEHIIQDACSTDTTHEVLERYSHLKAFIEKDSGMSEAINRGFKRASGKWVMWLNADDVLKPGALKRIKEFAAHHPDADVVYGAWEFVDKDRIFLRRMKALPPSFGMMVYYGCYMASTALFLRRETIIEQGCLLNETFRYAMDGEYYARLLQCGKKFYNFNVVIAEFRCHEHNLSAIFQEEKKSSIEEVYHKQRISLEDRVIVKFYGTYWWPFKNTRLADILDVVRREVYRWYKGLLILLTPWIDASAVTPQKRSSWDMAVKCLLIVLCVAVFGLIQWMIYGWYTNQDKVKEQNAQQAQQVFDDALQRVSQNDLTGAVKLYNKAAQLGHPQAGIQAQINQITLCIQSKQLDEAQKHWDLLTDKTSGQAEFLQSAIFFAQEKQDLGIRWCEKSASHGYAPAKIALAKMKATQAFADRKWDDAEKCLLDLGQTDDAEVEMMLGISCAQRGRYDEAIGYYRKAQIHGDAYAGDAIRVVTATKLIVNKQYDDAEIVMEPLRASQDPQVQFTFGMIYVGKKNLTEAKEWLSKASSQGHEVAKDILKKIESTQP